MCKNYYKTIRTIRRRGVMAQMQGGGLWVIAVTDVALRLFPNALILAAKQPHQIKYIVHFNK